MTGALQNAKLKLATTARLLVKYALLSVEMGYEKGLRLVMTA